MYLRAPFVARFFVLCQVYSNSRHLKSAPFAAALADPRPATLCSPANSQQGEPRPRCAPCVLSQQGERTRTRFARGFVALVNVSMFAELALILIMVQRYCFFLTYAIFLR